ncbi:serine aminopeptidase domain-containing protein [Puia dinghuensis]|uniref:Serine aminopeptidase S33 domain-containing protein n=1 Tax=Puia dinghuensis TaxID=1792502 RepID=A0A8J2XQ10_9BACT|nr:alpha/beta hydrolase [Puia dinghuensis]GGA81145.1 hypothetical protein GCM10011511_00140 [Puia dinghuensis]
MREEAIFLTIPGVTGRYLFTYAHYPEVLTGQAFVFLNPILDEKKKVHNFQAEVARALCGCGYMVFRFDYYGTGDSGGELFELDLNETMNDMLFLLEYIKSLHTITDLRLLGIRFGADLAVLLAEKQRQINGLFLIEPLTDGSRYLMEQRLRRRLFYKLKQITDPEEYFMIDDVPYEDFQGFPLSSSNIAFIESIQAGRAMPEGRTIYIFTVNTVNANERVRDLVGILAKSNATKSVSVDCQEFWVTFELSDTQVLTGEIVKQVGRV